VRNFLLPLLSKLAFVQKIDKKEHRAEYHARGFTSWGQFVAMVFCQLGRAHSLREIGGGLASCEGKLKNLGIPQAPRRSTLAYAKEHRPWELFRTVFGQLLEKCHALVAGGAGGKKKFRFKNKLLSLDGSVVDLCLSMYDWAQFRRTKGAVKLHLLLDQDGYLPSFAVITAGKTSELRVARQLSFERGTIVVMDRGYIDYQWFVDLNRQGVYLVTRRKENAVYQVVEEREPKGPPVLRDQVIYFPSLAEPSEEYYFRRVEVWDEQKQESIVFLTNRMKWAARTIAAIYKDRWQVELFFKALQQNLKIKTFVGTSANAVRTQIWTALIAMLVLRYLQLRSSFGWSLSNLVALLRQQLFVYGDLYQWLNEPFEAPPALAGVHDAQLPLDLGG